MKRLLTPIFAALLPVCFSAAAQPAGTFTYASLGGLHSAQALWDITGTYTISLPVEGLGQLSFDLPVVQDARGKLTGPGLIPVKAGTNDVVCTAKVRGSAKGPSQDFNVAIAVSLSGSGELQGAVRKFKGSLTLNLRLDPNTVYLVGNLTGNATIGGLGSGSTQAPMAFPLPEGMMGDWSLALSLQPAGSKLTGDATVSLGNGRTLPLVLSGSYSDKDGRGNFKLGGVDATKGAKLGIVTSGIPPVLNKVTGKILGVTLN